MLQQTRAETVIPYYRRWLRRFPNWDALARASSDEVVREWQGLGYYARARNLQRAARIVRDDFGGRLPADAHVLKVLPGVGDYTAAAVASIVHGLPAAAVDGNVRRVLSRLLNVADPVPSQLRREASRLLDPERPGDFNEAMMELGATLCLPRQPRCGACPVAGFCAARAAGVASRRPSRPRRPRVRELAVASAVLVDSEGRTLLVRRPEKGLLAGMWEFPGAELPGPSRARPPAELIASLAARRLEELGVAAASTAQAQLLAPVKHAFTHLRATYHPVVVELGWAGPRDSPASAAVDATRPSAPPAPPAAAANARPTEQFGYAPAFADDARPPARPPARKPPENCRMVAVSRAGFQPLALPSAQQKIALALERWMAAREPSRPPPPGFEPEIPATPALP